MHAKESQRRGESPPKRSTKEVEAEVKKFDGKIKDA